MQSFVIAAFLLCWMWPLVPGSFFGVLAALAAVALFAIVLTRKSWRDRRAVNWPRVPGRINHVYPSTFGRRVVLKLDCSWRAADGTVREQQHEYTTSRQRRIAVMEALYGASVSLRVDPETERVSILRTEDVQRLLRPATTSGAMESVARKTVAVDFTPTVSSH